MADHPPPSDPPTNGAAAGLDPPSKRQRRPSVRLGDIGEQPAAIPSEPYVRRSKPWKLSSAFPSAAASAAAAPKPPSKTRNLTTLAPDGAPETLNDFPPAGTTEDRAVVPVDENLETLATSIRKGSRDGKSRRGRRVRSSWISKPDDGLDGAAADLKSSGGEDAGDEGFRSEFDDLRREDSLSPSDRVRVRVSEGAAATTNNVMAGDAPSETDGGDWNDHNGRCRSDEVGGVRSWLNRLGLGRYAPVFEIHEVDDEALPLLTLEDLKDMGINAVGSRRKMYCAIQKLRKNFT